MTANRTNGTNITKKYPRLVVELGMGDGGLLEALAASNRNTLYIGIEVDDKSFKSASRIHLDNAVLLHGSFEDIVNDFEDNSVDQFLIVLPDPAYIDSNKEKTWGKFYVTLKSKLKDSGYIELVTEITDDLLEPVKDKDYLAWIDWLKSTFRSIGFNVIREEHKAPQQYSSRCLDQFRGDQDRIRMVTLYLAK